MALADFQVDIFTGINDAPRAATAELAGNGSDLIARFNGLVDFLIAAKNSTIIRFILGQTVTEDIFILFSTKETQINTVEVSFLDPDVSITVLFQGIQTGAIVLDDTNPFYQYNPGELVIPASTFAVLSINGTIFNNTVVEFKVSQPIFS